MKCTECPCADTRVIESRDVSEGESIRRRRECPKCGYRFTTYERIERPQLIVIKTDNTRQVFSREKILSGLYKACEKTPVTSLQLDRLVSNIENQLYDQGEQEVSSQLIGQIIMDRLALINDVAYVRFASVYRGFTDITSFEKELTQIKARNIKNKQFQKT